MIQDYVTIARDPFARQDTVRRLVETSGECSFCGQKRKSGKLFQYGSNPDAIRPLLSWAGRLFCSKACHESFYA